MSDDMRNQNAATRAQVLSLLGGGNASMTFDEAIADFSLAQINARAPHVAYSPWHLLEHLRRTQQDILEFVQDGPYQEKTWPGDYWPAPYTEADEDDWACTIAGFQEDLATLQELVADPAGDLHARLPNADADHFTLLREALLVADHNAYHTGEFAILRQVMGTWPADHDR